MKPPTRALRRGENLWALVEESIEGSELLINLSGELVRVQNRTGRSFRSGQRVQLRVQALFPLQLQIVTLTPADRGHLDVSI